MKILRKEANPSGAYFSPLDWFEDVPPEGSAEWLETLDTAEFYAYNGFIIPTIEAVEYTRQVPKVVPVEKTRQVQKVIINGDGAPEIVTVPEPYTENEVQLVEEPYTVDTVTGYTPNVEAWEEWKASLPEPADPKPTTEERLAALEEQVAQADNTAIELYEMQMAQEQINAAQDDALVEIYEMIGG